MREIKFRYVWKRKSDNHIWIEIIPIECIEGKGDKPFILQDNSLWDLIARDLYTGLKDKNSKEIYEGDIVRMVDRENIGTFNVPDDIIANGGYTGREDVWEGKITYDPSITCFGIKDKDDGFVQLITREDLSLEVIGNVWENKELLNDN